MTEPTIFVIDDDIGTRTSIERVLASVGLRAVSFASARDFLEAFDPETPGCVISDVRLPEMSGVELQQELQSRGAMIPMILITGYADVQTAVRSMKAGAMDFIEKPVQSQTLIEQVQKALADDAQAREERARQQEIQGRLDRLTFRERQVLELVVDGKTSKEIAVLLGVSPKTIHVHRAGAKSKMGARSVAEMARMLMTARLQPGSA